MFRVTRFFRTLPTLRQSSLIQTNDGTVGSIFGLTEKDPPKDRGKVFAPKNDPEKDQGKILTPKIGREINQDKVLELR